MYITRPNGSVVELDDEEYGQRILAMAGFRLSTDEEIAEKEKRKAEVAAKRAAEQASIPNPDTDERVLPDYRQRLRTAMA